MGETIERLSPRRFVLVYRNTVASPKAGVIGHVGSPGFRVASVAHLGVVFGGQRSPV